MIFDDSTVTNGDWFEFFESEIDKATGEIIYHAPKPGAAEFCIRSPRPYYEEMASGTKMEHKMVNNPTTRRMERVPYFPDLSPDEIKERGNGAIDFAITGVKNGFWPDPKNPSKNGPAIACTMEDKLRLMKIPVFERFYNRVQEIIDTAGVTLTAEAKEAEAKN